jgi:hypothetical protein
LSLAGCSVGFHHLLSDVPSFGVNGDGVVSDRLKRIAKISTEMAELQRQKNDAFRMKLRREVDLQTFREVTKEMDAALDQLDWRQSLTGDAAMPGCPTHRSRGRTYLLLIGVR